MKLNSLLVTAALVGFSTSAFAVARVCEDGGRRSHDPTHQGGRTSFQFECKSENACFARCLTGIISDAYLIEEMSSPSCVEGVTWGRELSSVWVDDGCEAVFEIFKY